jgi:hypothetical protein
MNLSPADLAELGKRAAANTLRQKAPAPPKPVHRDPSMAPSRDNLSPVITGPGRRTYMHFEARGAAIVTWDDGRDRARVDWISYETWKKLCTVVVAHL